MTSPPFAMVPTATIAPHPSNVRRHVGDVTEMAASMQEHGVLEPLLLVPGDITITLRGSRIAACPECACPVQVDERGACDLHSDEIGRSCPGGGGYARAVWYAVAGNRRLAAATIAGLPEVPAILRSDVRTLAAQLELMLIENLHRSDLTPLEEAEAYQQLALLDYKPAQIAARTGRSRSTVERRLQLLALPDTARGQIQAGDLTLADAEAMVPFASDPAAVAELEAAAGTPNFAFVLQRQRERAGHANCPPSPHVPVDCPADDPDEHDPARQTSAAAADSVVARLAEMEARDRDLGTAAAVRRDWMRQSLRPGFRHAVQEVHLVWLTAWWAIDSDDVDPRQVAALLGVRLPGATQTERRAHLKALALKATPEVCTRLIRAVMLASLDPGDTAAEWADRPARTRMFLSALSAMGYPLSDVERAQLDDLARDSCCWRDGRATMPGETAEPPGVVSTERLLDPPTRPEDPRNDCASTRRHPAHSAPYPAPPHEGLA